jgi:hypothetical protein
VRVGDILSLEGGIGKSFYHPVEGTPVPRVTSLGVAYYAQLKVTGDSGPALVMPLLEGHEDRVFGVGVEGSVYLPKAKLLIGLRVVPEFGARNRTQGVTAVLTLARELKSFVKPPEEARP